MKKANTATVGSWRDAGSMYRRLVRMARKAQDAGNVAEAQRLFKMSDGFFGKNPAR